MADDRAVDEVAPMIEHLEIVDHAAGVCAEVEEQIQRRRRIPGAAVAGTLGITYGAWAEVSIRESIAAGRVNDGAAHRRRVVGIAVDWAISDDGAQARRRAQRAAGNANNAMDMAE